MLVGRYRSGLGGDWGLRIGCDEEVVGRGEVVYVDDESVIFGCWL